MNKYEQIGRLIVEAIRDEAKIEPEADTDAPLDGDQFPHVTEARNWEGIPETDPRINDLLGTEYEWDVMPWCAHGLNRILALCGIEGTGTMRARDFAEWGDEGDGSFGDIAVFDKHVTIVVDNGKALGCNQGDTVKESNLQWYHDNQQFLAYRRVPTA